MGCGYLLGRGAFESAEDFAKRAESIRGVAVGKVLLEDRNYLYDRGAFAIRPHWDFKYISILKDCAKGRDFFINLSPADAGSLYTNERGLQIFADFTYLNGKLTVSNLYLETKTLGRIKLTRRPSLPHASLKSSFSIPNSSFLINSSSFNPLALGYGLELIMAYKELYS